MPYIILALGLLIGSYALYRFLVTASVPEIKTFFRRAAFWVAFAAMLLFALAGRFGVSVIILLVLFPAIWKFVRAKTGGGNAAADPGAMTTKEALEILDLREGASEEQVQESYKRLMQKVHPDNQGSDWMASKLNQARDVLLKP